MSQCRNMNLLTMQYMYACISVHHADNTIVISTSKELSKMNIAFFFSVLVLVICLLYCYLIQGVPGDELIWHAIEMVLSSWIGRCCGMIFCVLFTFGLCF